MSLFEAYITNLGKYAEGQLVGETLKFPTTTEEVQGLLMKKHPLCTFLAALVLAPTLMLLTVSLIAAVLATPFAWALGWL